MWNVYIFEENSFFPVQTNPRKKEGEDRDNNADGYISNKIKTNAARFS